MRLKRLRSLSVERATGPGRGAFISAASGLVAAGGWLYVIADDELHLGVFRATGTRPGSLVRLLPGVLPKGRKKRKAQKPDFEVLCRLPPLGGCPHGALLALASGSRANRRRGVLMPLDRAGAIAGEARLIDLSGLYRHLKDELGEVNVEGAVVLGSQFCLLNRGHPRHGGSAIVRLNLSSVLRAIARDGALHALTCTVRHYDLGSVDGVPLGFTDGTAQPGGGLFFSAIAERSADSYHDGPCAASAVGRIGRNGDLQWLQRIHPPRKVEGIAVRRTGGRRRLLLVTDADDARVPANLYDGDPARAPLSARTRPSRRSPSLRR